MGWPWGPARHSFLILPPKDIFGGPQKGTLAPCSPPPHLSHIPGEVATRIRVDVFQPLARCFGTSEAARERVDGEHRSTEGPVKEGGIEQRRPRGAGDCRVPFWGVAP